MKKGRMRKRGKNQQCGKWITVRGKERKRNRGRATKRTRPTHLAAEPQSCVCVLVLVHVCLCAAAAAAAAFPFDNIPNVECQLRHLGWTIGKMLLCSQIESRKLNFRPMPTRIVSGC